MAQLVEHVLGKDEVTSSNLVSSSKKDFAEMQSPFLFVFSRGHTVKKSSRQYIVFEEKRPFCAYS